MDAADPSHDRARPGPRPSIGGWLAALFTLGCAVLAFRIRSFNAAGVFAGDPLYLHGIDAYGYMRPAWLGWAHWPRTALFDTAIGFPQGLPLLSNIGFDFLLAAMARAIGGPDPSRHAAETICAWAIPAIGAMAPVGAFLLARRLTGRAGAMAAAFVVALIPTLVYGSRAGLIDQNAVEAPLALLVAAAAWDGSFAGRTRVLRAVLAGVLMAGAILVWNGFVLVAGILAAWAGIQRLADVLAPRAASRLAEGMGVVLLAGALALLAAEAVFLGRQALGIQFERLSLFQPLALLGAAAGLFAIGFLFPAPAARRRPIAAALCVAVASAALILAARGLSSGVGYVLEGPVPGGSTTEGRPFRLFGVQGLRDACGPGFPAYAIGISVIAARAIRDRLARPGDALLLVWAAITAILAWGQYPRYAPHLALPLALALGATAGSLLVARRHRTIAAVLGIALIGAAAAPTLLAWRPTKDRPAVLFQEPAREVLLWARERTRRFAPPLRRRGGGRGPGAGPHALRARHAHDRVRGQGDGPETGRRRAAAHGGVPARDEHAPPSRRRLGRGRGSPPASGASGSSSKATRRSSSRPRGRICFPARRCRR